MLFRAVNVIILMCCSLVADVFLSSTSNSSLPVRAAADNLSHALIAFSSWRVVSPSIDAASLLASVLCGVVSSFIDIDHFLVAKSPRLSDVVNIGRRPPFHASLPLLGASLLISVWRRVKHRTDVGSTLFGPIGLVAIASHHLRDALRRGIWLWPFAGGRHTAPLPAALVLFLTLATPLFVARFLYDDVVALRERSLVADV